MFEVKCAKINTKSEVQERHYEINQEAITNPNSFPIQVLVAVHLYPSGQHHVVPLQQW